MFATTGQLLLGIGLGALLALVFIGILISLIKISGISAASPLSLIIIVLAFLILAFTNTKLVGLVMEYNRDDSSYAKVNHISNSFIDQFAHDEDVRALAEEFLPEGAATLDGIASLAKDPVTMIRERMLSRMWWKVFWSVIIVLVAYILCSLINGGMMLTGGSHTRQNSSSKREISHRSSSGRYSSRHSDYRKR